jgi:hypothetical protein
MTKEKEAEKFVLSILPNAYRSGPTIWPKLGAILPLYFSKNRNFMWSGAAYRLGWDGGSNKPKPEKRPMFHWRFNSHIFCGIKKKVACTTFKDMVKCRRCISLMKLHGHLKEEE